MKNTMLRPIALLGMSLMMALSVGAQEQQPKVKINHKEAKYKSADLKVKDEKNERKIKSDNVKIKEEKEETKYKSADLKVKDEKNERKIKGTVRPMQTSVREQTELKTGETQVRAKEHLAPLTEDRVTVEPAVTPPVMEQVPVPKVSTATRKAATRTYAAHKSTTARRTGTKPKYIVRTKTVRDTVFVPTQPEKIVSTHTEYLHDTVFVNRVDTVVRMQTENTYSGYRVPRGDFKKVKLKREKNGEVWMKRKEKDGTKTEKVKDE